MRVLMAYDYITRHKCPLSTVVLRKAPYLELGSGGQKSIIIVICIIYQRA